MTHDFMLRLAELAGAEVALQFQADFGGGTCFPPRSPCPPIRRLCLACLEAARPNVMTDSALLPVLQAVHPTLSLRTLRRELDYLALRNWLAITEKEGYWRLKLTSEGIDFMARLAESAGAEAARDGLGFSCTGAFIGASSTRPLSGRFDPYAASKTSDEFEGENTMTLKLNATFTRCPDGQALIVIDSAPFNGLEIRPRELQLFAERLTALAAMSLRTPVSGKHFRPTQVCLGEGDKAQKK